MFEHFEKLGKHTLLYGFARITTALGVLILVPVLTRSFSPSEYGIIELAIVLISILTSFLMLGFDAALVVHYYQAKGEDEKKKVISTAFYFLLSSSLLITLILSLFAKPLSRALFQESGLGIVLLLSLWAAFFTLLYSFFANVKRLQLKPIQYFYLVATQIVLLIGFSLYFISQTSLGIEGILWAYLVASIFTAIFGFVLTYTQYTYTFSRPVLRSLLIFGIPLVFVAVTEWVLHLGDRLFLLYFTGVEQVGLYSLGIRIAQVMLLIIGGFQLAWGPFSLSIYKERGAKQTFSQILTYFTVVTCAIALSLTIFGKEIIQLVATPQYAETFRVIGPLTLGLVAYGSYSIAALGVTLARKTIHIAWTSGLAALLNIALNFILVPNFGMFGASIATVSSFIVSALLLYMVSQRYYPIPFQIKKVGVVWAITIVLMFVGLNVQFDSTFLTTASKLMIPVMFAAILLALGIFEKSEVASFFRLVKRVLSAGLSSNK